MRQCLWVAVAAALVLAAGCARGPVPAPAPAAPQAPAPAPGAQADPAPPPAATEPPPAETVRTLIAEAAAQPRTGGRPQAMAALEKARAAAAGDPALLAQVALAALDWDWQVGADIAREAVAADDASAPARVALGAALCRTGKCEEARPHLERAYAASGHSLESGYQLALALEALGETKEAKSLLADLANRFPTSAEVQQAQARLGRLLAVWPKPGARWWATSTLLLKLTADEQTVEAVGTDGALRWRMGCGSGKIFDVVFEEAGHRALISADSQSCLVDLTRGALLGTGPSAGHDPWLAGFSWQGDLIAIGTPIEHEGVPSSAYFGTDWRIYRLGPRFELLYTAHDGSRDATLSKDGRTLFSWFGNHGAGRPRLFRDGALINDYPNLPPGGYFALGPNEDRFYMTTYQGFLQAYTLDGKLLWQAAADKAMPPILWNGLIAVWHEDTAAIYDEKGAHLWSAPGIPATVIGGYLLVGRENERQLLDRSGKIVARYPRDCAPTGDRKAIICGYETHLQLYGLP